MTSTTHLGNTIKHAMGNFCKALLCMACVTALAGHARAQENPASPGNANPDWIPYNGKIENIDPGKYDIIFREVDTECLSNTETFEINLLEKPAAPVVQEIIQPTCVLHTGSVVLSALPEGNWIINPGNISGSGQTTTITDLVAGQSYAFTVTTSDECTSEPSVLVPINPAPFTPEPPTAEAQTLCAGSRVENLIAQYPSGTELRWYTTDQGGSALASGTELETNTYYAAAVSIDGCESTRVAVSVFVNPIVTPTVSITANKTEICDGDEVIFTAEVSENVTAVNYQWLLNDEPTGDNSSTFTSATLNNDDKIRCSVSVTGTCVSETPVLSDVYTVSVSEKITVVAKDDTQCGDLIGSFTALGLDPNKQYEYQLIPKSQAGKPVITLLGDNPLYWNLGETFVDPGATAYDAKDGDITSDIVAVNNVDINTEGTYQVTYNVTDSDGNVAEEVVRVVNILSDEVTIGTQTWKVKNLDIDDGQSGIYVYGGNDNNPDYDYNLATYGRLYTWGAAKRVTESISGWHLPSAEEWQTLSDYLGGSLVAGGKLKEAGMFHWNANTSGTNESGFTGLPAGVHIVNVGTFLSMGDYGSFWTSSESGSSAYRRGLSYVSGQLSSSLVVKSLYAISVRLIKDYSHTPVINIIGAPTININVGDTYTDAGATASDTRYGDITSEIVTVNNVNIAVAGTYTVTYNVTTEDGYSAVEVVRTVNVIPSAPQFEEVTIGTQTWMVRNLDIDDGLGGIYVYGGNENNPNYDYNLATYGRLYTFDAAMRVAGNVEGWHLPSYDEIKILGDYFGTNYVAGGKLKEAGTTHWQAPNTGATNESGFTGLPGGMRYSNAAYSGLGILGYFWRTDGGYSSLHFNDIVFAGFGTPPNAAHSVRLIKDYSHTPTITLLGNNPITINVGDTYTDAGATASDARYGDISADIVTENNVNTAVAGTYTVTYNVTTEDGYSAVEVVRTVNVIPSAPQFEEVTIGTQTWMAKNLDIDDGLGGIYAYNDDENNVPIYGRLYTWDAAMRVAASIDGWHLPSVEEAALLYNLPPSTLISVFGGQGYPENYNYIDEYAPYWTSTPNTEEYAIFWYAYLDSVIIPNGTWSRYVGFGVRLIKD